MEYPKSSSPLGWWTDQSEMVVLFETLRMCFQWFVKPLFAFVPGVRPFVLDARACPKAWTCFHNPLASHHPRATTLIPVLTRS
jgi:hypothetical protein